MIDDKYLDFFIGGNINEPVAIEIPLKKVNPDRLVRFFNEYGLDIDTTGTRPDKISVTKTTMRFSEPYCSVITPALNPNDLKKTYRILETLLDKYIERGRPSTEEIIYPHVLDLNNLVTQRPLSQEARRENGLINTLLQEAKQSDNIIIFERQGELTKTILSNPDCTPGKYLFSGSAMSDPYTVATTMYTRYFRYAGGTDQKSINNAVCYSGILGWAKGSVDNNFVNTLPNGAPVGFLHQYAARKDSEQFFFIDQGIERGVDVNSDRPEETMVNRFNNPIVATYVLWKEPGNSKMYAFKIPNNDERWALFKEYYAASYFEKDTAKRNKINDWIAEGKEHRTYTADEICGSYWKEKLDQEEEEKRQQREQAQQEAKRKEQITEQLDRIKADIGKVPTRLDHPFLLSGSNHQNDAYYKQYINDVYEVIAKYKEGLSRLDELRKELELIKSQNPDCDVNVYANRITSQKSQIEEEIKNLNNRIKTTKVIQENHILEMVDSPQMILAEPGIDFESKCKILNSVLPSVMLPLRDEYAIKPVSVIFNIYNILSAEEKKQLQGKFEYIKENASRQVLKRLIKIGKDHGNDTFVSLFKTSFITKITNALRKKTSTEKVEADSKFRAESSNVRP